jgi:glycosyltransferase involved in cell wall biosynthesis
MTEKENNPATLNTQSTNWPYNLVRPKVSIIISCYNCEKYLPACLESIKAQSLADWELFLLDDASNDNTKQLIENFSKSDKRVKPYYFQDNRGPYVRRNFAIERANSDFIIIQDSDDIMHPEKLASFYNEIIKDPKLAVVGSFYLMALDEFKGFQYADKIDHLPITHNKIMERYRTDLYICWHGSAIIRRSLFDTIGLYDENPYGSDKFWLAKAAEYARSTGRIQFKNIPEYLTYKIEHATSQQGMLPVLDPRSRRAKYQTYWLYKLMKIREKLMRDSSVDIQNELRNCKCDDYIERFGGFFGKWENELFGDITLRGFTEQAVLHFNNDRFVSCIITFNSIERIEKNAALKFRNFDLLRAMSLYATDHKDKSLKYLNDEIRNHKNIAAEQFLNDYFGSRITKKVNIWLIENSSRYDLRIVDTKSVTAQRPLVSVIMPAYNADEYIAQAIKSVLNQDYSNFELIIINDGSTDNTEKIISGFCDKRIKYLSQKNHGLAATCNVGIKNSVGRYIVKLDSDDMITPDFITKHLREFEKEPQADLVYCDDCLIDPAGKTIRVIDRPEYSDRKLLIRDLFHNGFPVVPFRTCIRKEVFEKIGLYDEELCVGEDYDMIRRFVMHGLKAHHLKGGFYLRRITTGSLSRDFSAVKAKSHFEVVERFVETFDCEDLYPDTDWSKVTLEKKRLQEKCLVAGTFMSIGKTYIDITPAPLYAETALEKARKNLSDALRIDPNNIPIRQLLGRFRPSATGQNVCSQQIVR